MANRRVLIVEDEELMRAILRKLLEQNGYDVFTADSVEAALDIYRSNDIALTLTDIKMAGRDGIELLRQIRSIDAEGLVIIMTAYSSVDSAVAALRTGAYDYVTKPFVNEYLLQTIRNALDHRQLSRENRELKRELRQRSDMSEMIGTSDALGRIIELVRKVAGTSANVLIQGESGTGKELVARALHYQSGRADRPLLAVNCGALPESLLESELFGHERGSFTGAIDEKPGLFRSVAGGTLFLDEVGEMPLSLQVKVLRALQEHEVTPIGASNSAHFDARIVAATNKHLEEEVSVGRFREDLYYRLNVVEIDVPPLRSRREDIPLLVRHFIAKIAASENITRKGLSPEALALLVRYDWPGNIRELEHAIQRAVILSEDEIKPDDLPIRMRRSEDLGSGQAARTLENVERDHIYQILDLAGDDKATAAEMLGIDLSTLYRKLKRYEKPILPKAQAQNSLRPRSS